MPEFKATRKWPFHVSCGGAVYREQKGAREYALLYRLPWRMGNQESWHLPKGTLNSGETLEACALREIREETGLETVLEGYLGTRHGRWVDRNGRLIDKTNHYFLARWTGGLAPMDDEHDRLDWMEAAEAMEKLDRVLKGEAEILRRAELFLGVFGPSG